MANYRTWWLGEACAEVKRVRDGPLMTRKPVIAAMHGVTIGGAVEMITNLDVIVAGESAILSLPEAKRGVSAGGGGIPRLVYLVGRQKG